MASTFLLGVWVTIARAEITEEHKKEIAAVRKEIVKVQSLISSKNHEEAAKLLDELHGRLHTSTSSLPLRLRSASCTACGPRVAANSH